jgi:small subunit ribosomal protein S20
LPRHKSALKRMKQAEKARQRNRRVKTIVRAAIKKFKAEENQEAKEANFKKVVKASDVAAAKGVIHKNKAARVKSRLAKSMKAK